MERLKEKLIELMSTTVDKLYYSYLTEEQRTSYLKELESLAKAYAALEEKNVTL